VRDWSVGWLGVVDLLRGWDAVVQRKNSGILVVGVVVVGGSLSVHGVTADTGDRVDDLLELLLEEEFLWVDFGESVVDSRKDLSVHHFLGKVFLEEGVLDHVVLFHDVTVDELNVGEVSVDEGHVSLGDEVLDELEFGEISVDDFVLDEVLDEEELGEVSLDQVLDEVDLEGGDLSEEVVLLDEFLDELLVVDDRVVVEEDFLEEGGHEEVSVEGSPRSSLP